MSSPWSTTADIRRKFQKQWDSGALLTALAANEPFPTFDVPLRGPKPSEIGDDLPAVRAWTDRLEKGSLGGSAYDVGYGAVGGRYIGRNQLPSRLRVTSYEQAWRFLGVAQDVARFLRVLDVTSDVAEIRTWVASHPISALDVADDWPELVSAYRWLDESRGSNRYLREISAPGVDTKFVERHRTTLSLLLGVERSATGLISGLGLRSRPDFVRLRFDPRALGLPSFLSEATLQRDELAELPATPSAAVIIENEVTYLSVPIPAGGVVIWGKGFEVDRAGSLPWLRGVPIHYWGDIDSHGFAILDRLRAWLPQARSFLMDHETLLAHADRWVAEPSPTSASMPRLTDSEQKLYRDLVADRLGERVRLEQERIDWAWVEKALPYS